MDESSWLFQNWQFAVGALLGVLGIVTGVAIALWQRRPEHLDYEVRGSVAILSPGPSHVRDKLQVIYGDGAVLTDPYAVTLRVTNTGRRGIAAEDYRQPISVHFKQETIYNAYVSAMSRDNLLAVDDVFDESNADFMVVEIRPPLLHAGDWFELTVINDGDPGEISVSADWPDRDRPMRRIKPTPPPRTATDTLVNALLVALGMSLAILFVAEWLGNVVGLSLFGAFTLLILGWALASEWRARKRR